MHFTLATSDEIARELAGRLRAHRLAQNLQQSELAAMVGVSERTLGTFERTGQGSLDLFLRVAMSLRLEESLTNIFELRPRSIKEMEAAGVKRRRASRTSSR